MMVLSSRLTGHFHAFFRLKTGRFRYQSNSRSEFAIKLHNISCRGSQDIFNTFFVVFSKQSRYPCNSRSDVFQKIRKMSKKHPKSAYFLSRLTWHSLVFSIFFLVGPDTTAIPDQNSASKTAWFFVEAHKTFWGIFFIFLRISPDTTPIPDRTNFLNFGCPCWFLSRLNFIFFFQPENVRSGSRGVNDKNTFLFLKNTEKHTIWTRFTRGNLTLFCKNYKKLDFDAITTCIILDVFFCENTKIRPCLPLIRPTTKSVWSGIVVLGART